MDQDLTLAEGKKLFKAYGCTHFHLYRDVPDLHTKYLALGISKEQEREWTRESFYELVDSLNASNTQVEHLWLLYSRIVTLAEYLKEVEILDGLERVSLELINRLPKSDAIMCAESILDTREVSLKCSVIFLAESLGMPELANKLVARAECFIEHFHNIDESRSNKARERLAIIKLTLKDMAPTHVI